MNLSNWSYCVDQAITMTNLNSIDTSRTSIAECGGGVRKEIFCLYLSHKLGNFLRYFSLFVPVYSGKVVEEQILRGGGVL